MRGVVAALGLFGLALASESVPGKLSTSIVVENRLLESIANITLHHADGFDTPDTFFWPSLSPGRRTEPPTTVHYDPAWSKRNKWLVSFRSADGLVECDSRDRFFGTWEWHDLDEGDADWNVIIVIGKKNEGMYFTIKAPSDLMWPSMSTIACRWLQGPKKDQELERLEENYLHQGLSPTAAAIQPQLKAGVVVQNCMPRDIHSVVITHFYDDVREALRWDSVPVNSTTAHDPRVVEFDSRVFFSHDAWIVTWRSWDEKDTPIQCQAVANKRSGSVQIMHDLKSVDADGLVTFKLGPDEVSLSRHSAPLTTPSWNQTSHGVRRPHEKRHGGGGKGPGFPKPIRDFSVSS